MPPIAIDDHTTIDDSEIAFETSRSSGPGGQHVNKTESRVTLVFDLAASPSLTADQKERIHEKLAGRISGGGILRVSAQSHRSQRRNRQAATERFAELLAGALRRRPPRRPTTVPKVARARRLEGKRRRGRVKRSRRPGDADEW